MSEPLPEWYPMLPEHFRRSFTVDDLVVRMVRVDDVQDVVEVVTAPKRCLISLEMLRDSVLRISREHILFPGDHRYKVVAWDHVGLALMLERVDD